MCYIINVFIYFLGDFMHELMEQKPFSKREWLVIWAVITVIGSGVFFLIGYFGG